MIEQKLFLYRKGLIPPVVTTSPLTIRHTSGTTDTKNNNKKTQCFKKHAPNSQKQAVVYAKRTVRHTNLNIALLNICSLKNKVLNLEKLADDRNILGKPLNFICLSEHWLREYEVQTTIIKNFEIVSSNARHIYKNGGTLIASSSNNSFQIRSRDDLQAENCEKHFETSALGMRLKNRKSKIIVLLNLYRSPSGDTNIFFDKLEIILKCISKEKSDFVTCGDFNIDLMTNKIHRNKLMDLIGSFGGNLL